MALYKCLITITIISWSGNSRAGKKRL